GRFAAKHNAVDVGDEGIDEESRAADNERYAELVGVAAGSGRVDKTAPDRGQAQPGGLPEDELLSGLEIASYQMSHAVQSAARNDGGGERQRALFWTGIRIENRGRLSSRSASHQ